MGEFDLIARYLHARPGAARVAAGRAATTARCWRRRRACSWRCPRDMLVEGRHFLSTVDPARLGHKALAVNLSDLAACGARPLAFTLALALPAVDEAWLAGFSQRPVRAGRRARLRAGGRRHHARAAQHLHHGVRRSAGRRGAAALGRARRRRPLGQRHAGRCAAGARGVPRHAVAAGRRLRAGARRAWSSRRRAWRSARRCAASPSAAIDISDGLVGDLGHILAASGVGATLDADAAVRFDSCLRRRGRRCGPFRSRDPAHAGAVGRRRLRTGLHRPARRRAQAVLQAGRASGTPVTRIGRIEAAPGLRIVDARGASVAQRFATFDHFV